MAEKEHVEEAIRTGNIDEAAQWLTSNMISGATTQDTNRRARPWFDRECYEQRELTLEILHKTRGQITSPIIESYQRERRRYKALIRTKKKQHLEEEQRRMVEEAEEDPYRALRPKRQKIQPNIPMETWKDHIREVICSKETRPEPKIPRIPQADEIFTTDEIRRAIQKMRNNRTPGPDGIRNEHIKQTIEEYLAIWASLLNKCMEIGNIPDDWRKSKIKLLYKGKGDTSNPNAYRGIALEPATLKLLTGILAKRLAEKLDPILPEEQFGFRRGRSTIMAVENLIDQIKQSIVKPKGKLYVVFVDYSKAFDLVNRRILVDKLEDLIGKTSTTTLISNILAENHIQIDDGVGKSEWLPQTNGVLQGDPLSPILFNVLTHDVTKEMEGVSTYIYADDMAIATTEIDKLQSALDTLSKWAERNDIKINEEKTELVVFRKGGRLTDAENVKCNGQLLKRKSNFKYLGITIQTTGKSFRLHIRSRAVAATRAMNEIRNITQLSMSTAMDLFRLKILPVLTYGLESIGEYITYKQLEELERVKARYLKRALGVPQNTRSRLVYELTRETFLIEDLRCEIMLPASDAYKQLLQDLHQKKNSISEDFYTTCAMQDRTWTEANHEMRHVTTRLATHGFHHKVCCNKTYHEPNDTCVCVLCSEVCDRYHITKCKNRLKSVAAYSKDK